MRQGTKQSLNPVHPTPYTLHPVPYTLHPAPYTLHPASYTLHPTPYTLHPTPYTLHPTPYTLHPTPYTSNLETHLVPSKAWASVEGVQSGGGIIAGGGDGNDHDASRTPLLRASLHFRKGKPFSVFLCSFWCFFPLFRFVGRSKIEITARSRVRHLCGVYLY
jgi:hypothetical protein